MLRDRAVLVGELPVELPRKRLRRVRAVVARVERHGLHALEVPAQLLEVEVVRLVDAVVAEETPLLGQCRGHLAERAVDRHREVERTVRHRDVQREVVEHRRVERVDELQQVRLHGVQAKEPAQALEPALEARVLLAGFQLAQQPVAQDLQHRAAFLAQRLPVPDALEHEPRAVAVQLELLVLRLGQGLQLLRVNVSADDGGNLVTVEVVGDDVEKVGIEDEFVEVPDHVPPESHRPLHRGSPCHILVPSHSYRRGR